MRDLGGLVSILVVVGLAGIGTVSGAAAEDGPADEHERPDRRDALRDL